MTQMSKTLKTASAAAQSDVRISNERAILTQIAVRRGVSAAELARLLGLGPQTVGAIVADLEARGLVKRDEVVRGARGQPAHPYRLAEHGAFAIGCELGWQHCALQLVDLRGEVVRSCRFDYRFPDARTVFQKIGDAASVLTSSLPRSERSRIIGVGVTAPAAIADHIDQVGGRKADAKRWVGVDVRERVEEATKLKTWRFSDGNAACWAELARLPHPRPGSLLYMMISTAIPSAVLADGRLLEGPSSNAADLGMTIFPGEDGKMRWLASIAGLAALRERLATADVQGIDADCSTWDWETIDPHVSAWIDVGAKAVAFAIVNAAAVVESRLAIVDGVMPRPIVQRYVESVQRHLKAFPAAPSRHIEVLAGQVGPQGVSKGAAMLLLFNRLFSPDSEHFER